MERKAKIKTNANMDGWNVLESGIAVINGLEIEVRKGDTVYVDGRHYSPAAEKEMFGA